MATVLIIEDRRLDRKLLATILRSHGHEIVESGDGDEALRMVARVRPDLVISDILMPTVDGYEFVRRMRENPMVAATPVIFYTATYHEREARALANQCGVIDILTKPSAPQLILATVDAALQARPLPPGAPVDAAAFDREHLQLVSSTLGAQIDRFETEKQRMAALGEVAQQIAAERDPLILFNRLCRDARDVTLAQHSVVGLLTGQGSARERLYTSGLDEATTGSMKPPSVSSPDVGSVIGERRSVRTRNPDGQPEALGLPADHPPVSSLLSVPIASPSRVYGWLSLRNKLGAEGFSDEDEQAALTLGTYAGIAYENARHFVDLHQRVTALETSVRRMSSRIRHIRGEERKRISRTLHDELGQALAGLKLDLHWLAKELSSRPDISQTPMAARIESLLQGLDESIQMVRSLSSALRPPVLEKSGLVAAIESHAREFGHLSGIACRVDVRCAELKLGPSRSRSVFRILQEALTNVLRHALATKVTVTVKRSANVLKISVADNGRGIATVDLNNRSVGLTGMRERAALLGGSVDVRRRRPAGTIVTLTIPGVTRRPKTRR